MRVNIEIPNHSIVRRIIINTHVISVQKNNILILLRGEWKCVAHTNGFDFIINFLCDFSFQLFEIKLSFKSLYCQYCKNHFLKKKKRSA